MHSWVRCRWRSLCRSPCEGARAPLAPLFTIAWLAAVSHIVLDVLSGARIKAASPLLDGRSLVPLVAMAEPWLIGGFTVAALALRLAGHAPQAGRVVQPWRPGRVPRTEGAVAGAGAADVATRAGCSRRGPHHRGALVLAAELAGLRASATTLSQRTIAPGRAPVIVEPWPVQLPPHRSPHARVRCPPSETCGRARIDVAREQIDERGQRDVLSSDIRFCWTPAHGEDTSTGPWTLGTGAARIRCGLWFGGSFAPSGQALTQRVQVFGRWQTRAVRP